MATRRVGISPDHVNALNLIEVDFYGCRDVQAKWRDYKDHLFADEPEDDAWREKKERLLANPLFEIAREMKFKIPAMDIFKGGYAPKGWAHNESRRMAGMEYVYELSIGKKAVPLWSAGSNLAPIQAAPPPLPSDEKTQE